MQIPSANPRIARLAPLEDALAAIREAVALPEPVTVPTADALGLVLAEDVRVAGDVPPQAFAYRDGWAVVSEDVVGASSYAPAFVKHPVFVEAGEALPAGADAVLPPDAIGGAGALAEATESVPPGDGVRAAGQDAEAGTTIVREGTRLDALHLALITACGIGELAVRRARIRLLPASRHALQWMALAARWLEAEGAGVEIVPEYPDPATLGAAFGQTGADGVVAIGGTGFGPHDHVAAALTEAGELILRGVALRPGETASFGKVGNRPVLLLPARPDALVAGLLTLGLPLAAALCGKAAPPPGPGIAIPENVSSAIGLTEIFLVVSGKPVPLAEVGLDALAQADGWFAVPPGSEGLAAGQSVQVRAFASR